MKIWNLTMERVKLLENELEAKTEEMAQLKVRQRMAPISWDRRWNSVAVEGFLSDTSVSEKRR